MYGQLPEAASVAAVQHTAADDDNDEVSASPVRMDCLRYQDNTGVGRRSADVVIIRARLSNAMPNRWVLNSGYFG